MADVNCLGLGGTPALRQEFALFAAIKQLFIFHDPVSC